MAGSGIGSTNDLFKSMSLINLAGSRHKIIVGIDYGTTFSGVSYVTTDKSNIDDINIISTWPGALHAALKTPTRIAYKRENSNISSDKWGFEVQAKLKSYSWTKLLLDKNALPGEYDDPSLANMSGQGMMRLPKFRNAEGVCEDYLRQVYSYLSSRLRQQMTDSTFDNTPMECWVTLPAIWSDQAKDATLNAAKRAGFGLRAGDTIFTIAEPEAAAIATLKSYSGPNAINPIKPNDHILICDCGGGTVDITTYTITQVEPRLEFDELCVGVGGKCGSTYIDRNLHELLSKRFGDPFDSLPISQKGPGSKFMDCFEMVKRGFGHKDDIDDIHELSPLRLDVPDSEYYDEEERTVNLTHKDMQFLFDPVISEITNLVLDQVQEVKRKKRASIDRIILVGGFGESPYLYKVLANWCKLNGNIKLMRPERPQSAVVQGAALRGLEGITPRMKQARRHYGICVLMRFREGKDPEEKADFDNYRNEKLCADRMEWMISKGEEVFQDTFRKFSCQIAYTPNTAVTSMIGFYSCALNDTPDYSTDPRVEKIGHIVTKFASDFDYGSCATSRYNPKLKETFYKFGFEVEVKFGNKGDNLSCQIRTNGKVVNKAVIEFGSLQ